MTVKGYGKLKLILDGKNHTIKNAYFVPDLINNPISLAQLQERGFATLLKDGNCKIYHALKGLIMETSMSENKMFVLFTNFQAMLKRENQSACSLGMEMA